MIIIKRKLIRNSIKKFNNTAKAYQLNPVKCWMNFIPFYIIYDFMPSDFFHSI